MRQIHGLEGVTIMEGSVRVNLSCKELYHGADTVLLDCFTYLHSNNTSHNNSPVKKAD